MRMFNQPLKHCLGLFLFTLTLSVFGNACAEETGTEAPAAEHHAESQAEWPGVYLGFVPCDDCNGIKTELALNKNNTYLLIYQFMGKGKSNRQFTERGKFTWGSQPNTVVLTPNKGDQTRQYQIGEDQLIQLDRHGIAYTGKDAERYVLRRNEVARKKGPHH